MMTEKSDLDELMSTEEVRTVYSQQDANRLLDQGWTLLAVGKGQEQTGEHDIMPIFGFCLGFISDESAD